MGVNLTIFEFGLFVKSKSMVQSRMTELMDLALFLTLQTKFVYPLRDVLKSINKNGLESFQAPELSTDFSIFHVSIATDHRFTTYIESGDWENEAMAVLVAQQYKQ